ncbi:MAG TPA: helix-turn-helix transcriptional regulator [Solirubrobacteraceae bacterium]|nr:helix-turn-helix transcriptional regulator [Solirubrobacteraceae bacterium]
MTPGALVREARRNAGLTQESLATRLGTTQSAVARLECDVASPRIDTLRRALAACGQELELSSRPRKASIDETLVARMLRIPPGERIKSFERSYANIREIALAGARSRGELA